LPLSNFSSWGDDVRAALEQRAAGLLDDALATLGEDLGDAQTALPASGKGLDLIKLARAEITSLGVSVDDRVGDDAHAVRPRGQAAAREVTGDSLVRLAAGASPLAGSVWLIAGPFCGRAIVLIELQ
jgi:hypothetical protein